jgi:regulator of sirC expression with transglutaminase-like and TPR domain
MFEKALQGKINDPVPHYYLGKIALEIGTGSDAPKRAINHLVAAIKLNESYAEAYRELGFAYYKIGDQETAIQAFERYLSLQPHAKDADSIQKSIERLR